MQRLQNRFCQVENAEVIKKWLHLVLLVLLTASCKKDEPLSAENVEVQPHLWWSTEYFKSDYTIQFPTYYTGGYVQGFEGGWFTKTRDDSRVTMLYNFSDGLQSYEFGDTLADVNATSIMVPRGDPVWLLDHRLDLVENEVTVGIFFYNEVWATSQGELYLKDGGVFKDALAVYYANDLKDEAIEILRTIQHN